MLSQVYISVTAVWANKLKNRMHMHDAPAILKMWPGFWMQVLYPCAFIMAGQGELVHEEKEMRSFLTAVALEPKKRISKQV